MGQTYLVGNDGNISFPVLGTLKVGGLSKAECEKLIHDRIIRYLNGKEDPVVTVRMANYKISVLGEVARPGMFTVGNEEINIFEALTLAGDLTIYGTMKVLIACLELVEHVLAYNSTQFHVLDALTEEAEQLLTANPPYTAGHHGFDGSKRKMTICINQE